MNKNLDPSNQKPEASRITDPETTSSPETNRDTALIWRKCEQGALVDESFEVARIKYELIQTQLTNEQITNNFITSLPNLQKVQEEHFQFFIQKTNMTADIFQNHPQIQEIETRLQRNIHHLTLEYNKYLSQNLNTQSIQSYQEARHNFQQNRKEIIDNQQVLLDILSEIGDIFRDSKSYDVNLPQLTDKHLNSWKRFTRLRSQLSNLSSLVVLEIEAAQPILSIEAQLIKELFQPEPTLKDPELEMQIYNKTRQFVRHLRLIDYQLACGSVASIESQLVYDASQQIMIERFHQLKKDPTITELEESIAKDKKDLLALKQDICEYNPKIANLNYQLRSTANKLEAIVSNFIENNPKLAQQQAFIESLATDLSKARAEVITQLNLPAPEELIISKEEFDNAWTIFTPAEKGALKRSYPQIFGFQIETDALDNSLIT